MSHFSVAVITKTDKYLRQQIELLLEPYDENMEVTPYIAMTKEEALAEIASHTEYINKKGLNYDSKTDQEKIEDWFGYRCFDQDGNPMTTYNPNSKWDWYEIGGRFSGMLNKNNCEKIKNIDFSIDMETYYKAMRWWDVVIDGMPLIDGEDEKDFRSIWKKEYFLDHYKTKENYAKISASIDTYAVITPDGKWHSKGDVFYFGMSSESGDESLDWDLNWHDKFIKTADPDWYITIVDCHI